MILTIDLRGVTKGYSLRKCFLLNNNFTRKLKIFPHHIYGLLKWPFKLN